tara:strand:- start:480 stop:1247 length:768 start_codon:yes stop_codon:yes gene_type:complete
MTKVLPAETGLKVQGVYHKYTITKGADTNATVSIVNKNANSTGNIYENHDNWDKIPGNTKIGFDTVTPSLGTLWGDGSISVDGDGTLSDVIIAYNYKYDTCNIPLTDSSCPGYEDALMKYLLDNGLINGEADINDPYYDEWVQFQLERKTEMEKEEEDKQEKKDKKEDKESQIETALSVAGAAIKMADPTRQMMMMVQMASAGTLDLYYGATIEGGTYNETIELTDGIIIDNFKALRNLAQDETHNKMVRSQYDN